MMGRLLAVLLLLGVARAEANTNYLVILTDDQRWDTLATMPHVQHLMTYGTHFRNAFTTTATCCPTRTSLFTGKYAHNTGVQTNKPPHGGAPVFDDSHTLATVLHDAGYRTGLFGKYLNSYSELSPYVPPGWDAWHAFVEDHPLYYNYTLNENGAHVAYGDAAADYSTDVLRQKVVDFLPGNGPFFVVFAPFAPHVPAIPAPRHLGAMASYPIFRPLSYKEADISEKPFYWQARRQIWGVASEPLYDNFQRLQREALLAVDEAIGAFLSAIPPNTLVIFLSDNGVSWGEHWDNGNKRTAYDEHIRIPLVMYGTGVVPHVEDRLILTLDLAPTLAHLQGLTMGDYDGRLAVKLIQHQPTPNWRTSFLSEAWNYETKYQPPTHQAVVERDWKYIRTTEKTGAVVEELYDRATDPGEMVDMKMANPAKLDAMRATLQHLLAE